MKKQEFFESADRYVFDFNLCSLKKGFAQIDTSQDAWYHGHWIDPVNRRLVGYVEGDVRIFDFDDDAEMVEYIENMAAFYESFGIDPGLNEEFKQKFLDAGLGKFLH